MKTEKIDLTAFQTRTGKLEKLFNWKAPSVRIAYSDYHYRGSGRCPVCGNQFLGEYSSGHSYSDDKHTRVSEIYSCLFCGFYSLFKRTRGFDDFDIRVTVLGHFSLFDVDGYLQRAKSTESLRDLLKSFELFFSEQGKECEVFAPVSKEASEYRVVLIRLVSSGITYAVKVAYDGQGELSPIQFLYYPEILWGEYMVKFHFSDDLSLAYTFEEAEKIFSFLRCYNDKYPPFYAISEDMKKEMIRLNAKYYYNQDKELTQFDLPIKYGDEIVFDVDKEGREIKHN